MPSRRSAATPLPAEVAAALLQGRKIEAIKLLRAQTGLGLKAAKEAVEAFEGGAGEARQGVAQRSPGEVPKGRSVVGWFVLALLLLAAGVYFGVI